MSFEATTSDKFEKNNIQEVTKNDEPSIVFRQNLFISNENEWQPFSDYLYNINEENETEKYEHFEDFESSPNKYKATEFQLKTVKVDEREQIIDKLKVLHNESKILMIKNKFLHKKYIHLIKNFPSLSTALDKFDECLIFEDPRYQQALENYGHVRSEINVKREFLNEEFQNLKENFTITETKYKNIFENLILEEATIAKKIKPRKISKEAWLQEVDRLLDNQRRRMMDVAKIRLAYIKLHYQLTNFQIKLKTFDKLGPKFSMIDYEILRKKKEIYCYKRDDQCESIRKYGDKNLICAGMIKHFDEELDLFNEKLENKVDILNMITINNQIKNIKNIEIVKRRGLILKNIAKLKANIGLLDNIYLLKKMESDLRVIKKLKKQSDTIKSKILQDKKKEQLLNFY